MRKHFETWRKELGLTQQIVADALGVTSQYYQQIEAGARQVKIDLSLATKLCTVFGVSLEKFMEAETTWLETRRS
ncbi:MAG: helix-turn-helix transcriptional regulator [Oscillospiraceae bacterium]|jgi:DNA-binding XRE family transcriptional regulator|nr:helix-turn-helix transcriptional regulator [Oscillospiraceae bacterium]